MHEIRRLVKLLLPEYGTINLHRQAEATEQFEMQSTQYNLLRAHSVVHCGL